MAKRNRIDLTNMVMVYKDDGEILVQLREKNDWPGLNFPGGHIEDNESALESAIREIKEETGLDIKDVESCGYFEWNVPEHGVRYVTLLFRTNKFSGEIKSSSEGKVFWIKKDEIDNYSQSMDFDKVFLVMQKGLWID